MPDATSPLSTQASAWLAALDALMAAPLRLAVFATAALALAAAYQAALLPRLGAGVGGWLLGVRVVRRRDGLAPGVGRAAVRGLGAALGALAFLAGPLYALWVDRCRRGAGDLMAGTVVVVAVPEGSDGA